MDAKLRAKYEKLKSFIREKGGDGAIVAFSGGVDSSTLAAVCLEILGDRVAAVTAKSATYPCEELDEAKKVAKEIGVKHCIVETNELSNEDFLRNPENRCYYCKSELLDVFKDSAARLGFRVIFEGTNYSDLSGHRPGFKAVKEREYVLSPWVEAKFKKEDIRQLARELGLSVHDRPASPCLASRIPFGQRITEERLRRVEAAEKAIREIVEVKELRVRDHDGLARIEVGRNERDLLFDAKIMDRIAEQLEKLGFKFVTMDMAGYKTGSMLKLVEKQTHDSRHLT
ncbi:MAG: ATP-dependent sacrificial sulfur transferase LarE [Promethearchaeati archaeon SRVP18_Atabeyarchaeia-1]